MTRLALAPRALIDLERFAEFLIENDPRTSAETAGLWLKGLAIMKAPP